MLNSEYPYTSFTAPTLDSKHKLSMSAGTRAMHQLHARVSATTQRPTASINLGLTYEIGIVNPRQLGESQFPP